MTTAAWSVLCLLAAGAISFAAIRAWRSIDVVFDRLDEIPGDRHFEPLGRSGLRSLSSDVVLLFPQRIRPSLPGNRLVLEPMCPSAVRDLVQKKKLAPTRAAILYSVTCHSKLKRT